jgi:hypothetical protein
MFPRSGAGVLAVGDRTMREEEKATNVNGSARQKSGPPLHIRYHHFGVRKRMLTSVLESQAESQRFSSL